MHALQAITTKYLAPTDFRGARVKATSASGDVITGWDYSVSPCDNHYAAARTLALGWDWTDDAGKVRPHAFGALPDGQGYVLAFLTP